MQPLRLASTGDLVPGRTGGGGDAGVLGRHHDDALEPFMMNLLHGGGLAAMPSKLIIDDGDLAILRPLIFCAEKDLEKFAASLGFQIIPCNLCGN